MENNSADKKSADIKSVDIKSVDIKNLLIEYFKKHQEYAFELFKRKNADYGDAFATYGEIGVLIRMTDKLKRLITIIDNKNIQVKDENIYDTISDLHNYSCMAHMLIFKNTRFSNKSYVELFEIVQKFGYDYFIANINNYLDLDKFVSKKLMNEKNQIYVYDHCDNSEYKNYQTRIQELLIVKHNSIELDSDKFQELYDLLFEIYCYSVMAVIVPHLKNNILTNLQNT